MFQKSTEANSNFTVFKYSPSQKKPSLKSKHKPVQYAEAEAVFPDGRGSLDHDNPMKKSHPFPWPAHKT